MSYFSLFPVTMYDPHGVGNQKLATNILKRVRVRANMRKEFVMLDPYDIQEGETPEIVADKHHGSPYFHWVVMILNNINNPLHDWPKTTREMQLYLQTKYGAAGGQDTIHHYEIAQSSGDTELMIEVPEETSGAISVTNWTYEWTENELKRSIDLLRNDYLGIFVEEFGEMIN
jgi:hypothetical protein